MNAISLMSLALPDCEPPEIPAEGVCCVTGCTGQTIARKYAIKPSFTNLDSLAVPGSNRVSVSAWRVLDYTMTNPGKKRDRAPLRQSSWVCDGESLTLLDRQAVRRHVLDGVDAKRWAGYVTTSYKKHGVLRTPINTGDRQVWLFEMLHVNCSDRRRVADWWSRLRAAQDAGIHRPLIESLDISPGYMGKVGWRPWCTFESWARPRMRSPLYLFLTYLLPSKEELKCECA